MSNVLSTYELNSIHNFNLILNAFEKLKVCHGLANNNEFQKVKTTFNPDKYIESFGHFRHAHCSKIVSNDIGYIIFSSFIFFKI